ncbi:MAG: histidine phosphatase family protein [Acidimicrobiia bacterium]
MIVFARHGQTVPNREGRLLGRNDAPLTEHGRSQADAMGAALAATGSFTVVTSPLERAADTAATIAAALGTTVAPDERLIELDYGDWDGRAHHEIGPDAWSTWRSDPSFAPPGGESLDDVRGRVVSFAEEWLSRETPVVAVSHVSPIKAAFAWALGVGDGVTFRSFLDLASFTRVGPGPTLLSFNETGHLHGRS